MEPDYACPLPDTPGAPRSFDGRNVSKFLSSYHFMCTSHFLSGEEKITRLPDYCNDETRLVVEHEIEKLKEELGEGENLTWEKLVPGLKFIYRGLDYAQQVRTLEYLRALKSTRCDIEYVAVYCMKFSMISKPLIENGELTTKTQCDWFLQGLPNDEIVAECIRGVKIPQGRVEIGFDELSKRARRAADAQLYMKQLRRDRRLEPDPAETLRRVHSLNPESACEGFQAEQSSSSLKEITRVQEDNFALKDSIERLSYRFKSLEDNFAGFTQRRAEASTSTAEENRTTKEDFERLWNSVKGLELEIGALADQKKSETNAQPVFTPSPPTEPRADTLTKGSSENNGRPPVSQPEPEPQPPQQERQKEPPRQETTQQDQQQPQSQPQPELEEQAQSVPITKFPFNMCLYCHGKNHRRQTCPDFQYDTARGAVHVNSRNKLSIGRADGKDRPDLPLHPGKCQRDIVADIWKAKSVAHTRHQSPRRVVYEPPPQRELSWRTNSVSNSERKTRQPEEQKEYPTKSNISSSRANDESKQEEREEVVELEESTSETQQQEKELDPDSDIEILVDPKPEPGHASSSNNYRPQTEDEGNINHSNNSNTSHIATYSDLPSLASCSSPENDNPDNPDDAEAEAEAEALALRSAEEAIQHMRTMETIGVEEFSVRSKQRQGGFPRGSSRSQSQSQSQSQRSRSQSQAERSEVSSRNGKGKSKSASGASASVGVAGKKKRRKGKIEILGTVVNNGDEGSLAYIGD